MFEGKKIILGVTGSIAAYKAALLARLLVKAGAEVKVVMTSSALDFITPLTMSTLTGNPAHHQFSKADEGTWTNHVELGLWADLMVIAPLSANTISKLASGTCDNLLLAVYLSARCPVFLVPAMDLDMFAHQGTQDNLNLLQSRGNRIIEPETGLLASGLSGKGRMAEPDVIVSKLSEYFETSTRFKGKKVMITAGPTYEPIDPVRFIGNHSSGKMGYALAEVFANRGADVHLISGPVNIKIKNPQIRVTLVNTADEMNMVCLDDFEDTDITLLAAAVADYKPENIASEKIKKTGDNLMLKLTKTPDIAAGLGKQKKNKQILAGFALETENEVSNAIQKLERKNFDFIVLNSLKDAGAGFGFDTNKVQIINRKGKIFPYELKGKSDVATDIVQYIEANFNV
jgi:phosphopantothenoylcysteine decarboxylase/phosphopantothenate--cysteine ligase